MGVLTLLKHLAPCLTDSHVEQYRGKTVAIDGNTFIFRGCYSCSEKVATGQPCSGPVDYLLKTVNMLKHYGVIPWVVLDGRRTPMKEDTNNQRQKEREKNLRIAKNLQQQAEETSGAERDALLHKAQTFFQKSIHVTRQMVTNAMATLKKEGVACMVAPYEADAQVAFLVKCGLASAVITEDSDILVYMAAVKCTASVLYKMDEFGKCKELGFNAENISSLPGKIGKFGRGLAAFVGEGGGRMFVQLATLAGCDYVNNIRGLGLLSALPIISKFKSVPADRRVTRIILHLQNMGKTVPEGHRDRMLLAEMSFFWHRVYDPRNKTCVHFCRAAPELVGTAEVPELSSKAEGIDFLGEHIDDKMAAKISHGEVDPTTGNAVIAETPPARAHGRIRHRSTSQPGRNVSPGQFNATTARAKSATMPMATPHETLYRQGRESGRSTGGGRPFPQYSHKQLHGRAKKVPKSSCGGLLKHMFERARSKAEENENSPSELCRDLQNVSDIVLACGTGPTPSRVRNSSLQSSTPATAIRNPFAKKPGSASPSIISPSKYFTSVALKASVPARSDASRLAVPEYVGGASDAWSRLSKGCLAGSCENEESTGSRARDVCPKIHVERPAEIENQEGKTFDRSVPTHEHSLHAVGKRAPSPFKRESKVNFGRKKKKAKLRGAATSQSVSAKETTILSFFGRTLPPKP